MPQRRTRLSLRTAAFLGAVALIATACGARLTAEQRAAGIGAGRGGNAVSANPGEVPGAQPSGGVFPSVGPSGGVLPPGGAVPPGVTPVQRCEPSAGGNKATDVGVTPSQITVAVASDVSGVQSGLFKSTHQAMQALSAFVNSQGGICGRAMKPLLLDTRIDAGANRNAVLEACQKAFALVGSMSALDNGGAQAGQDCGIPDISAITVNAARTNATNNYPAYPVRNDKYMIGPEQYIKQTYGPAVYKHAAALWLNVAVSKNSMAQRINALESIGYHFDYRQQLNVSEPNYNPFVLDMKDLGIEYVNFVGDYRTLVKIQDAMRQQKWFPKVRDWDSVAYSSGYLSLGGPSVEGSLVFLNNALGIYGEEPSSPEMMLYRQWLARVQPGAKPDYFGLYAWSAGRLFAQAATSAGPDLTRKKVFEELKKIHQWTGFGLHAAHDTGLKTPTNCFLYAIVKNNKFSRLTPASGWDCRFPLIPARA
ncbi:MAG: ABC transporter substrate-binding protein [Actinomycetota bacterium]|nr:ABC transporter substrate-binding protein [Actinomycetota bacterium]